MLGYRIYESVPQESGAMPRARTNRLAGWEVGRRNAGVEGMTVGA